MIGLICCLVIHGSKHSMESLVLGIRRKHELVEPKRLVSTARQWLSDSSPVSSSKYSLSWTVKVNKLYTSNSDSEGSSLPRPTYSSTERELYSGSSRSGGHEESGSEMYSVPSRDESSYESSGSMSRTPTKGLQKG